MRTDRVVLAVAAAFLAACGTEGTGPRPSPPYDIVGSVISDPTTLDIAVWRPDEPGSWPGLFLLHGWGGTYDDMEALATRVAEQGYVVVVPDYRVSELRHTERDIECAYRYTRGQADQLAIDAGKPLTVAGYSFGANAAWHGTVTTDVYGPGGTYDACFEGVERPDVVAMIAPCASVDAEFPVPDRADPDKRVVIVSGERDSVCSSWQQLRIAERLETAGYDVRLERVADATHESLIRPDATDGTRPSEGAAGEHTLRILLEELPEPDHEGGG
jgi:dienelactone hydrolase